MRSFILAAVLSWLCVVPNAHAQSEPGAAEFAAAVVKLDTIIRADARTTETLGSERSGSAVVIDATGLLLTVGYLVLEAEAALVTFADGTTTSAITVVNDAATGLALLRVDLPADYPSMALGNSTALGVDQDVVVLPHGGTGAAHVTTIASARDFSGSWEYHLKRAFYTTPATRAFSGAALVNRDAELVGIGSLLLNDIFPRNDRRSASGNLFIPVEHLRKHFGTLLSGQHTAPGRPWLGVTMNETLPDLNVVRVADESPAANAGLLAGDAIIALNDTRVYQMADFYQALWRTGKAGVEVELLIARDDNIQRITVPTAERESWYRSR
jgi:S1-C subfamily serine protease